MIKHREIKDIEIHDASVHTANILVGVVYSQKGKLEADYIAEPEHKESRTKQAHSRHHTTYCQRLPSVLVYQLVR